MSTFDHVTRIQNINLNAVFFKKSQSEAMLGFGQLARASMDEGPISTKTKELIALVTGMRQHCSGGVGFDVKALRRLQRMPTGIGRNAQRLHLYGRRTPPDLCGRSAQGLRRHGIRLIA